MKITKDKIDQQSKNIFRILLGNILITIGYAFITIPNGIITGGITGLSMIINSLIPLNIGTVANIITISLLILCLIFLGKEYFIHSLISSFFYLTLLNLFLLFNIHIQLGMIFNVIVAGIFVGLGYKFCIESKASTAGFDVIALIINKYKPEIQVGTSIRYISIAVMLMGIYRFGVLSVILGVGLTIIQTQIINILLQEKA